MSNFTKCPQYIKDGEYYVKLKTDKGKWIEERMADIVAHEFVPNDDPKHKTKLDFIDGNKLNFKANNLIWLTQKEYNERHQPYPDID
jgi:hypothetical protein